LTFDIEWQAVSALQRQAAGECRGGNPWKAFDTPAALALKLFDGHASGIYSFRYLRELCQCAACANPDRGPRPRA